MIQGMTGQERSEMGCNADRTHSWATTTVGDAEGLVEIQVANVRPIGTRPTEAHLGIEIGAIEIHLATVGMHQVTDAANPRFKHPMGGGIGDHQGRQSVGMLRHAGGEIRLIDVAIFITGHRHHLQAGHDGTGWIGAMGTRGNQANRAMCIPAGEVPGADDQKTGVFTLGAGIGLKRNGGKAGEG